MILIRDSDRKPIIMNVEDSNVNMRVKSAFGSMNANVPAHKSGKDIMIAFNPKFLLVRCVSSTMRMWSLHDESEVPVLYQG